MTAFLRGRDDRPATDESLPSHGPSETGLLSHQTMRRCRKGGAADEAAAMRKHGLAQAEADGRLREAPTVRKRASALGTDRAGRKDLGPDALLDAGRGTPVSRKASTGRCIELRFGHRPRRNQGFDPGSLRTRNRCFGGGDVKGGKVGPSGSCLRRAANRQGFGPVGEPAGETGWERELRFRTPEGEEGRGTPGFLANRSFEAARCGRLAFPAWRSPRRDSGGRQRCRPPLLFWGSARRCRMRPAAPRDA